MLFRTGFDFGTDLERNRSSARRLGDLPTLLERKIIAFENLPHSADKVGNVVTGTHHGLGLVTVVELGCSFDRVLWIGVVAISSENKKLLYSRRSSASSSRYSVYPS